MHIPTTRRHSPARRHFLRTTAAGLFAASLPQMTLADAPEPEPFDFDSLSARARSLAGKPYAKPEPAEGLPEGLTYDRYRQIAFDPDCARWRDTGAPFQLQAFHLGWLFPAAVPLHEVAKGDAYEMTFFPGDFQYRHEAAAVKPEGDTLPGVAGFRLHYPLNRADVMDELLAFQGASYFRALGRGNAYGLSSRGLAIATATDTPEEFPNFTEFYLDKPRPGDDRITIHALLDSPSVAGAYRFVVTPGADTVMDVTARLWFRTDVAHYGVAPLTSMFFFSEASKPRFDDYRPQVHDSDGLSMRLDDGTTLWRALNNPVQLSASLFTDPGLVRFGLDQRDRDYAAYQDAGARYHDRPSVEVEMLGDWGKGAVRLVEIPTDLEANDNIVAYWTPDGGAEAGEAREFRYRLHWGMLPPDPQARQAHVAATRSGLGGVAGVEAKSDARKFVVDFDGGLLSRMAGDEGVSPELNVRGGTAEDVILFPIEGTGMWRLAFDVRPDPGAVVEMMAHVAGHGQRLSETWMFQWLPEA